FYYAPGWWEPGASLEIEIGLDKWNELPAEYQEVLKVAAAEANVTMLSRYEARNRAALQRLIDGGVQMRTYSPEIMEAAMNATNEMYDQFAAQDPDFKKVYDSWKEFRGAIYDWNRLNEQVFTDFVYSKMS